MHVYVIEHTPSRRVYVGKANDVQKRWKAHLSDARRGKPGYFRAALRKYGAEEFRIKHVFTFGSEADAFHAEALAVLALRSNVKGIGFNSKEGGEGGLNPCVETREKMSASASRRIRAPHSEETRARMSAAKMGHTVSEDTRAKITEALTGMVQSAETKDKRAKSLTGKKRSPESRAKMSAAARNRDPSCYARAAATKKRAA